MATKITEGLHSCTVQYIVTWSTVNSMPSNTFSLHVLYGNRQKAKKARHEREKQYMEALGTLGHAVGEYVGGGQGDLEPESLRTLMMMMPRSLAMLVMLMTTMKLHRKAVNKLTLCCSPMTEATGLSIYGDHITEIAAKVVGGASVLVEPALALSTLHTTSLRKVKNVQKLQSE